MQTVLKVTGMMCPHCQAHVQKALEAVAGVTAVEVDLAGAQVGTANMTAKVIVPNTFSDAGAVGTYQVSVKLSEK